MKYLVVVIGLMLMVAAGLDLFGIYPLNGIQVVFGFYASCMLLYALVWRRNLKKDPNANK